ncbi:MAG: hypothetical protein AAB393_11020, partial [Bacteroidota bacterium]
VQLHHHDSETFSNLPGRVAVIEEAFPKKLVRANNGVMILQYVAAPGILVDTMQYTVGPDLLILTGRYASTTYHRTQIGSAITNPIQSILTVNIDSAGVQNPRVAAFPSAYVSKLTESAFKLHSRISGGWITVDVDSFRGTGTYTIAPNKGTYTQWLGDVGLTLRTDSLSLGTIAIDQYNEGTRRCAGRFEFTARLHIRPGDPQIIRRLSNGVFSAPVYR